VFIGIPHRPPKKKNKKRESAFFDERSQDHAVGSYESPLSETFYQPDSG
jgi:hypothetical protein